MRPRSTLSEPATLARIAPVVALAAAALWLWINFCRFPSSPWNDVRLAPALMAAHGEPVYTLPGAGIITTWMYGPVPLWTWAPAALAPDAASAILTAGTLNLLLTAGAIALTCLLWPCAPATPFHRLAALAAALVLWPDHAWRFLQADNVAVALGLLANLLLVRPSASRWTPWLAAAATAAALGCKPTTLGLLVAQLAWLGWSAGRTALAAHLVRTALAAVIIGTLAGLQFGFRELWFGAVTIPAALPYADSPLQRLGALAWPLALHAAIPLLALLAFAKSIIDRSSAKPPGGFAIARIFQAAETCGLPLLAFLASIPLGLAGMVSTGGSINSFQGLHFALPAILLAVAAKWFRPTPLRTILAALLPAGIIMARLVSAEATPLQPDLSEIRQAEAIHRSARGAVWLPWNPVVTWFGDGRFYHAEDGLYVRMITSGPVTVAQAHRGLPPAFRAIAFPSPEMQWGVALKLAPQVVASRRAGHWLVVEWGGTE